jgi:hypothetical protein
LRRYVREELASVALGSEPSRTRAEPSLNGHGGRS